MGFSPVLQHEKHPWERCEESPSRRLAKIAEKIAHYSKQIQGDLPASGGWFCFCLFVSYVHEYFACMYICVLPTFMVPTEVQEGIRFSEIGVSSSCKLPHESPGSHQEQKGLLTHDRILGPPMVDY